MEPIKCSRGRGVGSVLRAFEKRGLEWSSAFAGFSSPSRNSRPRARARPCAVGHLGRRRPERQDRQATRAHWPLPRRSHRTDGLERRRTGSTTQSTLHRLPTLRAGNARSHGRVQMIQSGVTRAVRAWAGEASSRLAAKSRELRSFGGCPELPLRLLRLLRLWLVAGWQQWCDRCDRRRVSCLEAGGARRRGKVDT